MADEGSSGTGFKREVFSSYTKTELIDHIQQQSEALERYEARFRDVVRAYKGILKEKEALETTLQALSASRLTPTKDRLRETSRLTPTHERSHDPSDRSRDVTESEGEKSETESGAQESAALEENDSESQVEGVADQVTKLMQSLSVLTEEKSKMESSFQQDKKRLLSELESMAAQHSSEKDQLLDKMETLQQRLEESVSRQTEGERERKREETEHGEMVRELQLYLNKERERSDKLENKLKDANIQIQTLHRQDRTKEYQEKIQSLSEELEDVRGRLLESEKQAAQPQPLLIRLQEDIKAMKVEHELSLSEEQKRASDAELKLQQQAKLEEDRVASLEAKLNVHANNELMEQLGQLQDKVSKLRQLLKVATLKILEERSSLPANLEDMSVAEYSELLSREPQRMREEMTELRQEFDSYKQKAQLVLKTKNNKEHESNKEFYELQEKYETTLETVERLEREKEKAKEEHSLALQKLRANLRQQAEKHSQEMLQAELEHKQKLQELQQHIQSTRERTRCLLEEKEKELSTLRKSLGTERGVAGGGVMLSRSTSHNSSSSNEENERLREDLSLTKREERNSIRVGGVRGGALFSSNIVQELTEQSFPVNNDVQLYLHHQEKERITEELLSLRSRKLELEDSMRDLTEREQRHLEQNMLLKEEIRKLERDRSRETENLEYLKNVIFHYMCSDSGQEQLIVPIATILHFTPNEIRTVKRRLSGRPWLLNYPYNK
uniref:GRIP domain-containing protein n=2 Tax=Amphimedon queenslandica TaxID=400682 RepID=A0A1X7U9C6_AMPQE